MADRPFELAAPALSRSMHLVLALTPYPPLARVRSGKISAGGLAAAAGTAGGFPAAFCVDAARTVTNQEGIGLFLSIVGWGFGLAILMALRYLVFADRQRSNTLPRARLMHE